MKPFLILQHRPIHEAADNELEAFMSYGGLMPSEIHRVRTEENGIPELDLENYSAIICGGGPSNVSDPQDQKSFEQVRYENDLKKLYARIFERDFPFLGACYGIGSLTNFVGGEVSQERYSEEVGSSMIFLTKEANKDLLTNGLPAEFKAFVGHKEACQSLASNATLLASSEPCPIQMIRFQKNIYATQFHPELDKEGLALRIRIYKNHGYFEPQKAEELIERIQNDVVTVPELILKRFVDRYRNTT